MQVMNGSRNSEDEWKFSPDSYGDFYGGLRDAAYPPTLHHEPGNDHHELPPDAFRPMEIPECTNERRSSLSVLLERESPVALSKDTTYDDEEYTPTVDTSLTTSSTISSVEILQSQLPSALKKLPILEYEQYAANTHWTKIVANVSSDSEDSDSDEEGRNNSLLPVIITIGMLSLVICLFNILFLPFLLSFSPSLIRSTSILEHAFRTVLGINVDGERLSAALPVTCLNFDRSPTKSMSQRLKIRFGMHNNDETSDNNNTNNNNSGKNNTSSSSYRAGAKVRFELERAAQKKPQFSESFHIEPCPPDASNEGKQQSLLLLFMFFIPLYHLLANINPMVSSICSLMLL